MKIENYNEILRNKITDVFNNKHYTLFVDEYYKDIDNLYNNLSKDSAVFTNVIKVMYISSYIVKYATYKINPDDEDLKRDVEYLENITNFDFIDSYVFRELVNDTRLYNKLSFYEKRKYFFGAIDKKDYLLKKVPIFLNDIIYFSNNFTSDYIIDYYYDCLKELNNKNRALEKTIHYASEFLIKLAKENYSNYLEITNDIFNSYYEYNKYLLDNNKISDEITLDILRAYKNDPKYLPDLYTCNLEYLRTILTDFIKYNTLSNEEKIKIRKSNLKKLNANIPKNINNKIRSELSKTFGYIDTLDESTIFDYQNELQMLKHSKYLDNIIKILYIDNYSSVYLEYLTFPEDPDVKLDYEYMKDIKTIKEFKTDLLENDLVLLNAINYSNYYYDSCFMDKKEVMLTLLNSDAYDNFIIKDYIHDVIELSRDYNLNDANEIFDELYVEFGDKKIAMANSVSYLSADLLTLCILDKKNYYNILYEIFKKFYMYNKYLLDNKVEVDSEIIKILNMIKSNIDDFFITYESNPYLEELIFVSYYEYIGNIVVDKEDVDSYYKDDDKGVAKIFKKNKNSD